MLSEWSITKREPEKAENKNSDTTGGEFMKEVYGHAKVVGRF